MQSPKRGEKLSGGAVMKSKPTLTLEYWEDDGWLIGRLREVPGAFSQGETLEELEENIKEVYQLLLEDQPEIDQDTKTKQLALC
jgi:predicted RNase H-like HicB family nuclease